MPLIRCTNVFYKGDYPVTLLPPPTRLAPSLGLGTTWVRQLRSGSCHHPTAATKCNEQRSQATETPSVEKHAHPQRVVNCAIYVFVQGRLSRHITSPSEKTHPESWPGDYMGNPTSDTKCNERPSKATENPVGGETCSSTKGGLLRYIPNTYSNHKVSSF